MRYEEYLFVCALRDCSAYFESCPYHTQYEKGGELYKKYLESELSKNAKVLYNSYNKFFTQKTCTAYNHNNFSFFFNHFLYFNSILKNWK